MSPLIQYKKIVDASGSISNKSVKIAWQQKSQFGNNHVFYTTSINDGIAFGKPKDISLQPPAAGGPKISSSGNTDYLAFVNTGPEVHPATRMVKFRDNVPLGEVILNQNDTNLPSSVALAVSSPEKAVVGMTRFDPNTGAENIAASSCSADQCSRLQNITGPSPYNTTSISENLTLTAPLPINSTLQPLNNSLLNNSLLNNSVIEGIPGGVGGETTTSGETTSTESGTTTGNSGTTNRIPTALNQNVSTFKNIPLDIRLTAKDPDKMDKFTFHLVSNPTKGGTVTNFKNNGQLTYIPKRNYAGTDSFTFKANDGKVDSSNTGRITINILDHPPVAQNGAVSAFGPNAGVENIAAYSIGIKLNATDADAGDVTILLSRYNRYQRR